MPIYRSEPEAIWKALEEFEAQEGLKREVLARLVGVRARTVRRWQGDERVSVKKLPRVKAFLEGRGLEWRRFLEVRPVWRLGESYEANLEQGPVDRPAALPEHVPSLPRDLLGHRLDSPLGIAPSVATANHEWVEFWRRLHFSFVTFKTVRTGDKAHPPHWEPTLETVPGIDSPWAVGGAPDEIVLSPNQESGPRPEIATIANSVGVPSPAVGDWQLEVTKCRDVLGESAPLIVSVLGEGKTFQLLASDFADCALAAAEAGAQIVELNISSPNLFFRGEFSGHTLQNFPRGVVTVVREVRRRLNPKYRSLPIILKLGYMEDSALGALVKATRKWVDGYVAINALAVEVYARVLGEAATPVPRFPRSGPRAGISGLAIREYAHHVVGALCTLRSQRSEFAVIGVGGVSTPQDVERLLEAGADAVETCTAALFDRFLGSRRASTWRPGV